jgi:hypothetical protein
MENSVFSQVGIGTSDPAPSAKLEISSTTKGFLPPRMTSAQRDAITSPAEGLVIFNTTTGGLETYASGWKKLATAGVNTDITKLNALSGQGLITRIAGPIVTSAYSAGDVVFDASSGSFYFFRNAIPAQNSLSYGSTTSSFIFSFEESDKRVIRFKPTGNYVTSITIGVNNAADARLSIYEQLKTCGSGEYTSVEISSLLGSSTVNSGDGNVTFTFATPVPVTPGTYYYLTFDERTSVNSIMVGSPDPDFSISYGGCSIDVGASPAVSITYGNFRIL